MTQVVVRFASSAAFADAQLGAWALGILRRAELAAHARLRPPAARLDYLAAHALLRTTLAGILGCEPGDLGFDSSPWGQPRVVTPVEGRQVHFSISHSDGVALCAVSLDGPVGADVESLRNVGSDPMAVVRATCSPAEVDALRAVAGGERRLSLLDIWTRKEAILKATGLGFHLSPGEAVVDWAGGGHIGRAMGSEWGIAAWRLTPSHLAAVAVRARPEDVVPCQVEEVAFSDSQVEPGCETAPDPWYGSGAGDDTRSLHGFERRPHWRGWLKPRTKATSSSSCSAVRVRP